MADTAVEGQWYFFAHVVDCLAFGRNDGDDIFVTYRHM